MKRILIATLGAAACCFAIWQAARIGMARTLAQYAALTNERSAAERAVRTLPNDAETHSARGIVLQRTESYPDACNELDRAVQLRPRDYFPWMLLGVTRDLNQNQPGAVQALRQSIALAPTYAKPHWLLGNLLLRMGQTEEAFKELRAAASSDSTLWPNVIDLAWGVNRDDAGKTIAAIQPQTDAARMTLAIFFARHKQGTAALDQYRATKSFGDERAHELVHELLAAKLFPEAHEVWTRIHGVSATTSSVLNGGFEDEIAVGLTGFGWQIPSDLSNVTISIDPSRYQNGAKSLRVDFHGASKAASVLASEFVIVKPNTRYRLTFYASSKDFISAASPVITLTDAADEKKGVLARSSPLITDASAWRVFDIDFSASPQTQAINITLSRQECPNDPCPAYGTLWLDSFALSEQPGR